MTFDCIALLFSIIVKKSSKSISVSLVIRKSRSNPVIEGIIKQSEL